LLGRMLVFNPGSKCGSLPESEKPRLRALRRPCQRSCFGRAGGRAPPRWGGAHRSTHNSALRHRPRDTGVVLETEQGAALTARRDLKEAEVLPNRAHSAAPADVQTRSDLRQGPCRRSAGPVAIHSRSSLPPRYVFGVPAGLVLRLRPGFSRSSAAKPRFANLKTSPQFAQRTDPRPQRHDPLALPASKPHLGTSTHGRPADPRRTTSASASRTQPPVLRRRKYDGGAARKHDPRPLPYNRSTNLCPGSYISKLVDHLQLPDSVCGILGTFRIRCAMF
jgi:hypothetical protein